MSKIVVDKMPYHTSDCPFYIEFWDHDECNLDGKECIYFNSDGDPNECPWLVPLKEVNANE